MEGLSEILSSPQDLEQYLEKNSSRILSDWSYSAGTSNHAALGAHTHVLVKTFDACSKSSSLGKFALELAQGIIRDHLKIIYRSLFLTRPRQTVPAIELLQRLAKVAPDSLYNGFDLSLKVIPKLLISKDFRAPFIRFYISFIHSVGPVARRDLIGQKKIIKSWLSKLSDDNDLDITLESIDCLVKCVLRNKLLAKPQKLSFFNDSILQSLVKLLTLGADIAEPTLKFFTTLFCDQEYGVAFPDAGWYSQSPNNRLTLSFLNLLRPWENLFQMDLTIKLLDSFQELMYPYFDHLAKVYPFVPKQSMFWFNYAVLISRAIQTPIPELDSVRVPELSVVIANILPQPLTKSHLYAAVTFKESPLLAFTASQIVLYSLRKLEKVLHIYNQNVWDTSALTTQVTDILPAIQVFSTTSNTPLLQTVCLSCASTYYKVLGSSTMALLPSNLVGSVLEKKASGLDMVQAQSILEIQTAVLGSTKWYNKQGDNLSFFSRLLKFALLNPELSFSAIDLLKFLVKPLLAMQSETVAHPVSALLYTLEVVYPQMESDQQTKLWNLIDEAISRSARSPYGYIDKYPTLLSPFATALVEQFAFVESPNSQIRQWLASYIRALGVIGENVSGISQGFEIEPLPLDDYYEFILSEKPKIVLKRDDIVLKIVTPLELMATVYRAFQSPELAQHLLFNIPPNFVASLGHPTCFQRVLNSGNIDTIKCYLDVLRGNNITSSELSKALENSSFWPIALDLINADFLLKQVSGNHTHQVICELTNRAIPLPIDVVKQHLDEYDHLKMLKLEPDTARELMMMANDSKSVAALVEASGFFDDSIDTSPQVLLAACNFAPQCISEQAKIKCLDVASELLETDTITAIRLFVAFKDTISERKELVCKFLDNVDDALVSEYAILAAQVPSTEWVKRAVLQLTKAFSELESIDSYGPFFISFTQLLDSIEIWTMVSGDNLNALISSLVKRIELGNSTVLLGLLNALIHKPRDIQHSKHLQVLLDQEPGFFEHKLLINLAIWQLFNVNSEQNSTKDTQIGILRHYSGLWNAADSLLLDILRIIEANTSSSWVDNVLVWDLQAKTNIEEYDRPVLASVIERGNRLQITLCDDLINGSTIHYDPHLGLLVPSSDEFFSASMERLENYDILHPCHGYSDEFLLGCIVSCDQLVKDDKIDVKVLCEMNFLPFIICCLCSSNSNVSSTAQLLLEAISSSINDEKYKESIAVKLVVNKALLFLHQSKDMPAHIAILLAQIAKISITPGHFLHEKVSNWLMSGPSIQSFDLPLYNVVVNSDAPLKPQELLWLVKTLTQALVDSKVSALFVKLGVFEWAFTQLESVSPRSKALKSVIHQLLTKAKLSGGSNGLIRRTAALSSDPDHLLLTTGSGIMEWMGYV